MKKIFCVVGFIFFITTVPAYADYIIYCRDGKEFFVKNYQITEVDVTYITNYGIYHLPLDKVNIEKTEYERDMKDHGPKWQELQKRNEEEAKRIKMEEEAKRKQQEEEIKKRAAEQERTEAERIKMLKEADRKLKIKEEEEGKKGEQKAIDYVKKYQDGKIEKTIKNLLELERIKGALVKDFGWWASCGFGSCEVKYSFRSRDILHEVIFDVFPSSGTIRPVNQLAYDVMK